MLTGKMDVSSPMRNQTGTVDLTCKGDFTQTIVLSVYHNLYEEVLLFKWEKTCSLDRLLTMANPSWWQRGGCSADSPVPISTVSHSSQLTHVLDSPHSLCPGLGLIHEQQVFHIQKPTGKREGKKKKKRKRGMFHSMLFSLQKLQTHDVNCIYFQIMQPTSSMVNRTINQNKKSCFDLCVIALTFLPWVFGMLPFQKFLISKVLCWAPEELNYNSITQ